MKRRRPHTFVALVTTIALISATATGQPATQGETPKPPDAGGATDFTLQEALAARRSVREFADTRLSEKNILLLCWAAQGITDPRGFRTAPSAGATYPLELYVLTAENVRRYVPARNALVPHLEADLRGRLQQAALNQEFIGAAPAVFVIVADVQRTARRYGDRAERYVLIEVGHAAQNLLLQAVALKLGAVPVGAFEDGRVAEVLRLPGEQRPFYLVPVGWPKE